MKPGSRPRTASGDSSLRCTGMIPHAPCTPICMHECAEREYDERAAESPRRHDEQRQSQARTACCSGGQCARRAVRRDGADHRADVVEHGDVRDGVRRDAVSVLQEIGIQVLRAVREASSSGTSARPGRERGACAAWRFCGPSMVRATRCCCQASDSGTLVRM